MKVVFKLNKAQIEVAQQIVAEAKAAAEKMQHPDYAFPGEKFSAHGNVGGLIGDVGFGVSSQSLSLEGGKLVYEGQRTALVNGCANSLAKILKIFNGDIQAATAAVIYYKTSDPHRLALQWFEVTSDEAVLQRASSEVLQALITGDKAQTRYAARDEAIRRFPRGIQNLAEKSASWLRQTYSSSELNLIRAASAAL